MRMSYYKTSRAWVRMTLTLTNGEAKIDYDSDIMVDSFVPYQGSSMQYSRELNERKFVEKELFEGANAVRAQMQQSATALIPNILEAIKARSQHARAR